MKHESDLTRVHSRKPTNLLLFPDEPSLGTETTSPINDFSASQGNLVPGLPLCLSDVTFGWRALLKRLGRCRHVLETILSGGRPIRLTDHTLVIGFPPHRRFHQELLEIPEYRMAVEAELMRAYGVPLAVVTALNPEFCAVRRKGVPGKTPA